jgi:hypothetical protein
MTTVKEVLRLYDLKSVKDRLGNLWPPWRKSHDSTISSRLKTDLATIVENISQSYDPHKMEVPPRSKAGWGLTPQSLRSSNHDATISSRLKTDSATIVESTPQFHDPNSRQALRIWHVVQWKSRIALDTPFVNTSQLDRYFSDYSIVIKSNIHLKLYWQKYRNGIVGLPLT